MGAPLIRSVFLLTTCGPLRSCFIAYYRGPLRISFFAYYMGAPSNLFLCIPYGGLLKYVSLYTMRIPSGQFFAYYMGDPSCYVLLIQRSVRQKESTQDKNSRKRFNYLYSYSRSFFNPHLIKLTYRT